MEGRFFGEGQSRAFEALRFWHEAGRPSACVVHGPSGAGKSTVVERFFRSITGPGTLKLLVHAGRTFGAAFEEEVLARLSAGPWPEGTGFDEFHFGVRTSLVNRIANWDGEDGQPQLLMGLLAPDACVDWPDDPRRSVLDEPGPGARVLVTVSGARDVAEQWAERLGLRAADVTYVSIDGFRLEDVEPSLRDHLAWAAVDGPGPRAHVDAIARSLRDRGAAPLEELLTTLACAFAPLDATELAPLLGAHVAEVIGSLDTHREAVDLVLQWREEGRQIRFRHETLRAAWVAAHPEHVALAEQRFAEAARALVRTWESVDTGERGAVTYLRRYAGDHLVSAGAPRADLLPLGAPRWAWPRSREDLAARRAELGRVRRSMSAPLGASDAREIPPDALSSFVRIALAQGALATLHRAWPPEADRADEEAWNDTERALVVSLFALAARASPSLRADIEAPALDVVRRTGAAWRGDGWEDALTFLTAARAASGDEASTFARWAVSATWRAEGGPDSTLSAWLTAADFLPRAEAEALVQQAIQRALSSAKPGQALARLATAKGMGRNQALALLGAAVPLPPTSRANALAPLLPVLPDAERALAVSMSFDALFADHDEGAERHDVGACTAALLPFLGLAELSSLLDEALPPPSAMAVRFAELGDPERALGIVRELCGSGIFAARPLLCAAATEGGRSLVQAARDAVASLEPPWVAAGLVCDHAAEAIQVLGLEAAVAIAEGGGGGGSEAARIMALAALCLAAPEPSRPTLAARAVTAYHDDRGTEALESVVRCAPWMSLATAARLFIVSLGDAAEDASLVSTLSRWGGVEQLAPLIARIGGDEALAAAASVLSEALRWKLRANAGSKECSTSGVAPAGLDDGRSTME
ncbi:ATP-binding protein [Sorangium cellulosum]|uniref:Uncharacterized protein n=1 Tax=Sorangium cellulosum TaxID=56 RepID=A0A150QFG6_SORCE|nr:ATP-binding protein [Sorangium cellulosum]KYF66689.1 hypothetical protein BE15_12650 [Sorangium cellulosum]